MSIRLMSIAYMHTRDRPVKVLYRNAMFKINKITARSIMLILNIDVLTSLFDRNHIHLLKKYVPIKSNKVV